MTTAKKLTALSNEILKKIVNETFVSLRENGSIDVTSAELHAFFGLLSCSFTTSIALTAHKNITNFQLHPYLKAVQYNINAKIDNLLSQNPEEIK